MDVKQITNEKDLRSATILLNASGLSMCNAKTVEELVEHFGTAKDLLIELYKYNATRIIGNQQ